jgi:2-oxoisovalerate dehydrogenase E1 component alpha subunit
MEWIDPAAQAPITTFSLMDANSVLRDETQISPEVTPEVVLGWYKNMLTGKNFAAFLALAKNKVNGLSIVNILDSIMFDAQRHGRLSFYMV